MCDRSATSCARPGMAAAVDALLDRDYGVEFAMAMLRPISARCGRMGRFVIRQRMRASTTSTAGERQPDSWIGGSQPPRRSCGPVMPTRRAGDRRPEPRVRSLPLVNTEFPGHPGHGDTFRRPPRPQSASRYRGGRPRHNLRAGREPPENGRAGLSRPAGPSGVGDLRSQPAHCEAIRAAASPTERASSIRRPALASSGRAGGCMARATGSTSMRKADRRRGAHDRQGIRRRRPRPADDHGRRLSSDTVMGHTRRIEAPMEGPPLHQPAHARGATSRATPGT